MITFNSECCCFVDRYFLHCSWIHIILRLYQEHFSRCGVVHCYICIVIGSGLTIDCVLYSTLSEIFSGDNCYLISLDVSLIDSNKAGRKCIISAPLYPQNLHFLPLPVYGTDPAFDTIL